MTPARWRGSWIAARSLSCPRFAAGGRSAAQSWLSPRPVKGPAAASLRGMPELQGRRLSVVALAVRGEAPAFHVAIIGIERSLNDPEGVRIGPQKFRFEARVEAEHVLVDENLSVDVRAGANADRRDFQEIRHLSGGRGRHAFEHEREASCLF